jgi:hypothetical protein
MRSKISEEYDAEEEEKKYDKVFIHRHKCKSEQSEHLHNIAIIGWKHQHPLIASNHV